MVFVSLLYRRNISLIHRYPNNVSFTGISSTVSIATIIKTNNFSTISNKQTSSNFFSFVPQKSMINSIYPTNNRLLVNPSKFESTLAYRRVPINSLPSRLYSPVVSVIPFTRSFSSQPTTSTSSSSIFSSSSSIFTSTDKPIELNSWGIPKGSLFDKIKYAIREYGKTALIIYSSLWIIPFISMYTICQYNHNFHQDPIQLIEWLIGIENRTKLWSYFQLPINETLHDKTISLLYAYIGSELIETPRLLLTLYLSPKIKLWYTSKQMINNSTTSKLSSLTLEPINPSVTTSSLSSTTTSTTSSSPKIT